MICPNCATENEAGAKFCNECGMALAAGCPNCGATNKPGAKFCNECGTALGSRASSAAPAAPAPAQGGSQPVAERRLVTVLFADIVGFTPFAEQKDAEDVRDTLTRYFDLCSAVITKYGGTIEKFIGDAVMAVWGAPVAFEDDAERAVRAALELIEAVPTLAPGVQARAGLLTGEAAVTLGATNQGMVAGDLVNTAARLQSVAEPGTVLAGEATARAATGAIFFEEIGGQTLKGKQAPVAAFRALRVVAERGGRNRSEALEAPFVGRSEELRLLKDLLEATGRERKARLVSIMGPAGIGKSRLGWELLKYIDGLVETIYWHSGRSPAYGEGITFWALGEMVRGRCQLVESDDEAITRQKVADTLDGLIDDEEQRGRVERGLLTLLGVESGLPPEQLFTAWRTFFEAIARQGTVVMVFEDLHNADSGTLDFIDHMLEWSRGAPIFVVTLARPDFLERRSDWGAGQRNFTSIFVEPLPDHDMRELITGLAPGLPEAAVEAIVGRADGIPLYAVETVRMLLAEGRLREEQGKYVPVADLSTLSVPETLTALISSRLDALDPADRSLVQDAAVLGQSFSEDALAAVSGTDSAQLASQLAGLVRREIFGRDIDSRSPERGQYIFVQALVREVAYNTLARRDRKTRHLAAARYFEGIGSDELASALANHYLAAQRHAAEGDEADALAAQARIALKAAGDRAARLGANDQAIVFLEQALAITKDEQDRADLLERAGSAARTSGRFEAAEGFFRAAIEIHAQSNNRTAAARATAGIGDAYMNARRNVDGLALMEEAWAEYRDLWPAREAVEIRIILGRAYSSTERHEEALEAADDVLAVAEKANLLKLVARGFLVKGIALASFGRLREAIALFNAAEQLARDERMTDVLVPALLLNGFHLNEVDLLSALEKYREGLQLAEQTGQRMLMFTLMNNVAFTNFMLGEWDESQGVVDQGLASGALGTHVVWLVGNKIMVDASRGKDVSAALAELEQGVEGADEADLQLAINDVKGTAAFAQGDLMAAAAHWRAIAALQVSQGPSVFYQAARCALWTRNLEQARTELAALDATGIHGLIAEIRRQTISAGIAALEGRVQEAQRLYRDALRGWADTGMVWDGVLTAIDMAELLGQDADSAVTAAARKKLVELGAQPFVERLDAALARADAKPGLATARAPAEAAALEPA